MTVSMKMSSRSDFMISDAAIPQRLAELDQQQSAQMNQFAKILGGFGNDTSETTDTIGAADVLNDIQNAIEDLGDDEKLGQALKELDDSIQSVLSGEENGSVFGGEKLPTEVAKLAKMVVDGELELKNIPSELVTEELMKAIIAQMIENRLDEETDEMSDVTGVENTIETTGEILSELYRIIDKINENRSGEGVEVAEVVEQTAEDDKNVIPVLEVTEIGVENKVTIKHNAEPVVTDDNVDEKATTEEKPTSAVLTANMQVEQAVESDVAPVISEQMSAIPTVNETQSAVSQAVSENTEQVVAAISGEEKSDNTQMRFGEQAQKTEKSAETVKTEEFDNVIESFTVNKKPNVPTAETLNTAETKTVNVTSTANRVQNASEELEMLKSAKFAKVKDSDTAEVVSKPTETANPLMSDQPIVFTRTDGTEISVKPSDIIEQATKLIEKAVEETKEQSEYSLVLNPEELGRITVKLIKAADGAVSVTIAAENAHTQRVLEQHSELMQNSLRSNGMNLASWQTVDESRQEAYAQDYNGSSKNPYFRRENAQQNNDDDNGGKSFADIIASM